jgi:hypothetical protein
MATTYSSARSGMRRSGSELVLDQDVQQDPLPAARVAGTPERGGEHDVALSEH